MATENENKRFANHLLGTAPLNDAIAWISDNMGVFEVYTPEQIKNALEPVAIEKYVSREKLKQWAEDNGYAPEAP